MASILSLEVHQLVQATDLKALSMDDIEARPLVLDTLGILEWSNIYHTTEKGGSLKALSCLKQYIAVLGSFESKD